MEYAPYHKMKHVHIIIFFSCKIEIMSTPNKYKKLYTFVLNLHLIY
jgi:hypothetical protein